jgi:hypothetical protein
MKRKCTTARIARLDVIKSIAGNNTKKGQRVRETPRKGKMWQQIKEHTGS